MVILPEEAYNKNLSRWLGKDRYVESVPDRLDITRGRIGKDLLDPDTDPQGALRELAERQGIPSRKNLSIQGFMSEIDLSVLNQTWRTKKFYEEMETAKKFGVAGVCVYGSRVADAVVALKDTNIAVAAAIDFDKGQGTLEQRVNATKDALDAGATEIDMPINLGRLFSGEDDYIRDDLAAVWKLCRERGAIFKPIANVDSMDEEWKKDKENYVRGGENPYIRKYCALVKEVEAALPGGYGQVMFKTSTGFDLHKVDAAGNQNYQGALVPGALRIFHEEAQGTNIRTKAAGKVRNGPAYIENMAQFGVGRFGCTTTPQIYTDLMDLKYISHRPAA